MQQLNLTALLLCFLSLSFVSIAQESLPPVEFRFGNRQLNTTIDQHTRTNDLLTESAYDGKYYRWVQFNAIPSLDAQNQLKASGVEFIEYVRTNCYLMSIPATMDMQQLYKAGARAMQKLGPQSKVDPRILDEFIPEENKVAGGITLKVMMMPGADRQAILPALAQAKATSVRLPNHDRFIIGVMPLDQIETMSAHPGIRYIELMDPKGEPESVEGMSIQRGNILNNHLTGGLRYDGDGVGILVRDDGDVGPHIDFAGRLVNDAGNIGTGNHGDGVAGVWAACGNIDPTIVANASAADVYVIDYLASFLDNTLDYHLNDGVMITNSSYSNGCNDGYTTTTYTVDTMLNENLSFMHVFSAGNSNFSDCGYGAGDQWGNITGGHKQGKNVLTVANLFRNGDLVGSSSRGPAHDGRIKPDIAGHGQGQMSTYEGNKYQSFGGTSAAAPSTAGNMTQLYDAYRDLNGGANPQSALIKACMLNSAQDYGNVGPDYKYGWGVVHAGRAYDILANNQYLSSTIVNGGSNTHSIVVPSNVGQLRIMVYWNDPAASVGAATALVNDIDMVVRNPSNVQFMPYILDPTPNPVTLDLPATTGEDHLNNMEQVAITNPAAGTYNVDLTAAIPIGVQEYFVVYSFIPTGVELIYPLGNEKMVPGVIERIHWDAFGNTGSFDVEYSTNNGGSWNSIATGLAAGERGVDWLVPAAVSEDCLVRVTRGAETDECAETFTIHAVPEMCASDISPTEALLSWTPVAGATSYDVYTLIGEKMSVIATTANSDYAVSGLTAGNTYWYSVSANTGTIKGQRAIAYEYQNGLEGDCAGCTATFTPPYSESFEGGIGDYCNPSCGDYFDWTVSSGGTPSSDTGPSAASNGTQYAYCETSAPNNPNRPALLISPCFDLTACTGMELAFDYHMYGLSMGTLIVEAQVTGTNSWTEIFSISGNQGDSWFTQLVDLSSYCGSTIQLRFRGISGSSFRSDIAIDNIVISETTIACIDAFPWTDNFDSYAQCSTTGGAMACNFGGGWTQDQSDGNDWRINAGTTSSTFTGPDNDNTSGTGNYAYIEASTTFGLTSNMWTPCLDFSSLTEPRLSFYYHMYGGDMGTLNVDVSTNNGNAWTTVWTQTGAVHTATSDPFSNQIVDLTAYAGETVLIRFQGIAGASYNSDMAIDDILVYDQSNCSPISALLATNITSTTADLSWTEFPTHTSFDIELVNVSAGETAQGLPDFSTQNTNYSLTNLMDGTIYEAYVRGNCGGSATAWVGPVTFVTPCIGFVGDELSNPIIAALPYDAIHNTDTVCFQSRYAARPGKDVFFEVMTQTDTLVISTCYVESVFDTYLYLLNSNGDVVASNDDADCGVQLNGLNRFSVINANVVANETYYIVVEGFFVSSLGNVRVTIDDLSNCVTNLTVSGTPAPATYQAGSVINSDALIQNPNQVIFAAPEINLNTNFEVEMGAEFSTTSTGCN